MYLHVRIDAFMKESVNISPFQSFEPMNFPFSLFGPWYDCTTLTVLCFNFIHHFIPVFEEPYDTKLYKHVAASTISRENNSIPLPAFSALIYMIKFQVCLKKIMMIELKLQSIKSFIFKNSINLSFKLAYCALFLTFQMQHN